MDIVVFGAGALGSLVGGALAREHAVTFVGRDPHVTRIREDGLRLSGELDARVRGEATTESAGLVADLVLVTVKAYDTAAAAEALADGDVDLVCSLQNGLTEGTLRERLGDRVLAGTATCGAELVDPGHVRCTGQGRIHVGELEGGESDRAERAATAFRAAGLDCEADPAMPRRRWEKLAVNAGINAVTALARAPNGALAGPPGNGIAERAAREAARVARSEGVDLADDDAVTALRGVVDETAANRSSMYQDVRAGRRTEVDAINGAVVDLGRANDVAAPTNESLAGLLRTWEAARDLRPTDTD